MKRGVNYEKGFFLLIMFAFFIEASSCNNSPFDVENGVLKKYHWQKCEETENEKAFITRNMIWVNLEQERNYNDLVLVKIERR